MAALSFPSLQFVGGSCTIWSWSCSSWSRSPGPIWISSRCWGTSSTGRWNQWNFGGCSWNQRKWCRWSPSRTHRRSWCRRREEEVRSWRWGWRTRFNWRSSSQESQGWRRGLCRRSCSSRWSLCLDCATCGGKHYTIYCINIRPTAFLVLRYFSIHYNSPAFTSLPSISNYFCPWYLHWKDGLQVL